jgi:hypothetical protein
VARPGLCITCTPVAPLRVVVGTDVVCLFVACFSLRRWRLQAVWKSRPSNEKIENNLTALAGSPLDDNRAQIRPNMTQYIFSEWVDQTSATGWKERPSGDLTETPRKQTRQKSNPRASGGCSCSERSAAGEVDEVGKHCSRGCFGADVIVLSDPPSTPSLTRAVTMASNVATSFHKSVEGSEAVMGPKGQSGVSTVHI